MLQFGLMKNFPAINNAERDERLSGEQVLASLLAEIEAAVPPLWPLSDYVTVNPFLGLASQRFLAARQSLREVRDCELLPSLRALQNQLQQWDIHPQDIVSAWRQCVREEPDLYAGFHLAKLAESLEDVEHSPPVERRCYTISEVIDRRERSAWSSHIVNDITRHCSAYYDGGQAGWRNPWKHLPLYEAWRESASLSRRMDALGIQGFRLLVRGLPSSPLAAIAQLLRELKLSAKESRLFLRCQLSTVAGWGSFVKYRVREAEIQGERDDDLIGLVAIRLAYDVALIKARTSLEGGDGAEIVADAVRRASFGVETMALPESVLARNVLQVAAETAYRRRLLGMLTPGKSAAGSADRKTAQMVFCIDVRSEVLRRHLESLTDRIETFGFAGFFGLALEYVPLGEAHGSAQCPVLLQPGFRVHETVVDGGRETRTSATQARRLQRIRRKVWKSFQSSAASCFSFVESLGLFYGGKLLTDSLRLTRPALRGERDGLPETSWQSFGPDLELSEGHELPLAKRVNLAEGMLRNLGLTDGFARIVVICGHAADVVNNPYKAGLDCGACGGHSGEPNARVAAAILNTPQVRAGLESRGVCIPDDTWFVPAVHITTTDEIRFLDVGHLPPSHEGDFRALQEWTTVAGGLCRAERSRRLKAASPDDVFRRSRDWSEVRPEWGLAGNAAFIVGPRSLTNGRDLGGRTFLHSYDHRRDPDFKVLELIMTAPMIVTSWINLQYYASAVDNRSFGSGNKVLHDVVGRLGVLEGNGGDLMTGLPWQSVHDGEQLQHQPLRLLVVIQAPREAVRRVIQTHQMVSDLVGNGWISLVVLDEGGCHRWTSNAEWEEVPGPESLVGTPAKSGPADSSLRVVGV